MLDNVSKKQELCGEGKILQVFEKAYAKINLVLDVLAKRDDGFHEVRMIMQTIDLADDINIKKSKYRLSVMTLGEDLPDDESNIAYRAALLMGEYAKREPDVQIVINKKIPMAAGLAGGSSDAAAVIRGLARLWNLPEDKKSFHEIAARLGSDVPFCLHGGTALSYGRGELVDALPECPEFGIILACPDIAVSTRWVYENFSREDVSNYPDVDSCMDGIKKQDKAIIAKSLGNVLETVTAKKNPVIDEIKNIMDKGGARASLMSGSGPSVFGLIDDISLAENIAREIREQTSARVWITKTRGQL